MAQKIGYKASEEARRKISKALTGRKLSKEHIANMKASLKGRVHSEETRRKIGVANSVALKGSTNGFQKGCKWPSNFKKGHKLSKKAIEKMSATKKGIPWSEARRKAQPNRPKKPVIKNGREYHSLWHELRKIIYKRDKWLCQECGKHCHKNIACHHIDYDITNNDLSNLITLCTSCHAKTNFKRENWIIHYKNKIGA
jgi:hypothetical protein